MPSPRICIIGAGEWSTAMHQPAIVRLALAGRLQVAGVCDLGRVRGGLRRRGRGGCGLHRCRGNAQPAPPGRGGHHGQPVGHAGDDRAGRRPPSAVHDGKAARHRRGHTPAADRAGRPAHPPGRLQSAVRAVFGAGPAWLADQPIQSITCTFSRYRRRDPDFTTTAVHGIDAVRFLAGSDYAKLRIEATQGPCGTGGLPASGNGPVVRVPTGAGANTGGQAASGTRGNHASGAGDGPVDDAENPRSATTSCPAGWPPGPRRHPGHARHRIWRGA